MERGVIAARTFCQALAPRGVVQKHGDGLGKRTGGAVGDADSGFAIGEPFVGASAAEGDNGAAMGEALDADEAEGFMAQDREEDDLAPVVPLAGFGRGNLTDELDPVLKGKGTDLGLEGRALPAFTRNDQFPWKVVELADGVDRDMDALWCEKPGGQEEQAGFGGAFWSARVVGVQRDEVYPFGVDAVFQQALTHEVGGDLKADPMQVAELTEALGSTPQRKVANRRPASTALNEVPGKTGETVWAMAGLELPGHPVATGTEPCLIVQEECRGGDFGDLGKHILPRDRVDLDNVGLPLPAQVADGTRRAAARDDLDTARDFARTGDIAAQQGFVTVFGEESAGLHHDAVRAAVDGAGKVVEEEDAHRFGEDVGWWEGGTAGRMIWTAIERLGPRVRSWGTLARGAVAGKDLVALIRGNWPPLAGS